jgi:beta-galactosidase GanA
LRWFGGLVALLAAAVSQGTPPHLEKQGTAMRLIVKGRPMLILGGELGNSSASSATYMAPHWLRLKQLHLNAVLTPVSWELIEPVEGRFDWSSVDALLQAARPNDLKLVLLWFGAWKNSMSTYAPAWVKRDQARFPRAQLPNGQGLDILSAFAPATRDADARAFSALLGHIKSVDGEANTVLMIQVENEIGMLPVAREYGPAADRLFHDSVPDELVRRLAAGAATATAEHSLRQDW